MAKITKVTSDQILDSRGIPTLKATVFLDDNSIGTASAPSGTSVGLKEAKELRDGDHSQYNGMGVLKAIENVKTVINDSLLNKDSLNQEVVDNTMIRLDGTNDKSKLGANAIVAVSLANAVASAASLNVPLYKHLNRLFRNYLPTQKIKMPRPMLNLINGGKHAKGGLDFQEFMIIAHSFPAFVDSYRAGMDVFTILKNVLLDKNIKIEYGAEGGYAIDLTRNRDAIENLREAINKSKYNYGGQVGISLDIAANTFYRDGTYSVRDINKLLTPLEMSEFLSNLTEEFKLISLEDPLYEEDWEGWRNIISRTKSKTKIISDDFSTTNVSRLKKIINAKAANGVIIKTNQVGTLTEAFKFVALAKENNFTTIVSHRSGETLDTFISDLAVSFGADYLKSGAPNQPERIAKYQRLIQIENELKEHGTA